MNPKIVIRSERDSDVSAITEVTVAAFKTLEISNHTEQFIIEALRAAKALTVSLVAEVDGRVIGHIAFSPVTISDGTRNWYGLGPVSVLPEYPRQGIGKALIREGLSRLKDMNAQGCCLVGHPDYYSDHRLETCRGCCLCFDKGEEFCPLKDDRDVLIEKIMASDGVVLASPNYSFQVSAIMKIFLDRLGFAFHRPRFFGKTFTSIVAQGIYGGNKIVKYLDFVGYGLGFNTVKGSCFTALQPMTEKEKQKIDRALARQSRRFYERLVKPAYPVPTLFKLMAFRMGRTSKRLELDDSSRDYAYYKEKGWFESDYFYPTRLGALKRAAGSLFDLIQTKRTRNRHN